MSIPTPHLTAAAGAIAETVLMPSDPLSARRIAATYLDRAIEFNEVRNMLGYTGFYRGRPVSVMGSGIGMPSMGIYSYELYNFYGVKRIIKLGGSTPIQPDLKKEDLLIAMGASTAYSHYADSFELPGSYAPIADYRLVRRAADIARRRGISSRVGTVLTTDVCYPDDSKAWGRWAKMGVLAWEMETAALYMNAARAGGSALSLLVAEQNPDASETYSKAIEIALTINEGGFSSEAELNADDA
ncbi:DeoD-type purine-nucleoside phosphorylase [Cohnella sp. AR92]|uniref:DeoD-type purine-nucleoside phosphorylase n=1 Tax=Cohnella sp. AR92 TaxID=648716 RepID=UPI000F8D45FE|nr:DeoD-type purine-nucleoside phosphorylase [Cohnella sp. AR92]RUS47088.1 DeoD-type purine-nucleoside phosphorylase [Cohnella sp. AR92]